MIRLAKKNAMRPEFNIGAAAKSKSIKIPRIPLRATHLLIFRFKMGQNRNQFLLRRTCYEFYALVAFLAAFCPDFVHAQCPAPNRTCNPTENCFCPGFDPPGGLRPEEIPQIVHITFDDAITVTNYPLYQDLIFSRKNPNGANITSTFFINHEYNNYQLTHQVYRQGHEIALHSISHRADTTYWSNLNYTGWLAEIEDHKFMVAQYALIPPQNIHGFRAPFLQIGGDAMYRALVEAGLQYDSSRPTRIYAGEAPKLWPYTNDFNTGFQDCQTTPCPTGNYPGFWTTPMVSLFGGNGFPCAMIDTCLPTPTTRQETFDLLKTNFDNHYVTEVDGGRGNRAPFGVYTHAAWLQGEDNLERLAGFSDFLDYLATLDDVYIVSMTKALEWIRAGGIPLSEIETFEPWQNGPPLPNDCANAVNCYFRNDQTPFPGDRYMMSCAFPCPNFYPWVFDPFGEGVQ